MRKLAMFHMSLLLTEFSNQLVKHLYCSRNHSLFQSSRRITQKYETRGLLWMLPFYLGQIIPIKSYPTLINLCNLQKKLHLMRLTFYKSILFYMNVCIHVCIVSNPCIPSHMEISVDFSHICHFSTPKTIPVLTELTGQYCASCLDIGTVQQCTS